MGEVLYKFGAQIPQECEFSQKKSPLNWRGLFKFDRKATTYITRMPG
ncbi:hypothetical protein MTsN1n28_15510 [Vibrio alginolyticus]|jgi:hypothetical protein